MRNKINRFLFAGIITAYLAFLVSLTPGCKGTLESGGAYSPTNSVGLASPDMTLFVSDSAYQLGYNAINTVFESERANRDLLFKLNPDIKHTLDTWRPQAVSANAKYLTARAAYIASPTPDNLTGVQKALAEIQRIGSAVATILPK